MLALPSTRPDSLVAQQNLLALPSTQPDSLVAQQNLLALPLTGTSRCFEDKPVMPAVISDTSLVPLLGGKPKTCTAEGLGCGH